jgi:LacI family transcriptional regulator
MPPRVSRDDVARLAGVSASTVSRALNNSPLLPDATRHRVQEAAAQLGYQINAAARSLAARRCFRLGFGMPGDPKVGALRLGYYAGLLAACVGQAAKVGYQLSIVLHQDTAADAKHLQRQVEQHQVDGFILAGLRKRSPLATQLRKLAIPCVLIGSRQNGLPCIDFDPGPGIRALALHAAETGRRRMLLITGDPAFRATETQLSIWETMQAADLVDCQTRICGSFGIGATLRALGEIPDPTAYDLIACANDRSAIGAYRYLRQHGLKPGADIAVCGFDDDEHARILDPGLTTVLQPRNEAGALAVDLLVNGQQQPIEATVHLLPTAPVFRESL